MSDSISSAATATQEDEQRFPAVASVRYAVTGVDEYSQRDLVTRGTRRTP